MDRKDDVFHRKNTRLQITVATRPKYDDGKYEYVRHPAITIICFNLCRTLFFSLSFNRGYKNHLLPFFVQKFYSDRIIMLPKLANDYRSEQRKFSLIIYFQ